MQFDMRDLDKKPEELPLFKFNMGQEVYVRNYKKNGMITHREYHDNGMSQWKMYVVRMVHDDGRSEGVEVTEYWIETDTKRED